MAITSSNMQIPYNDPTALRMMLAEMDAVQMPERAGDIPLRGDLAPAGASLLMADQELLNVMSQRDLRAIVKQALAEAETSPQYDPMSGGLNWGEIAARIDAAVGGLGYGPPMPVAEAVGAATAAGVPSKATVLPWSEEKRMDRGGTEEDWQPGPTVVGPVAHPGPRVQPKDRAIVGRQPRFAPGTTPRPPEGSTEPWYAPNVTPGPVRMFEEINRPRVARGSRTSAGRANSQAAAPRRNENQWIGDLLGNLFSGFFGSLTQPQGNQGPGYGGWGA